MRIGIAARPQDMAICAKLGFDYAELDVNDLLRLDEDAYYAMTDTMSETGIRAEVLRGILPADTRILGENVSFRALGEAMDRTLELARLLGTETLVFDCPTLRKIPTMFDPAEAWRQMGNFIRKLQAWGATERLNIALMPLRRSECDMIRHLSEAAMIPSMLRLDRIGIAASLYDMSMEAESQYEMRNFRSLLMHVGVSDSVSGRLPVIEDAGIENAMRILRECGYAGRVTLMGECDRFETDAAKALRIVKEYLK